MIVAIILRLTLLGALALRLRWWMRHENSRQNTLATLAEHLPLNRVVEFDDLRGDGTYLRLRVGGPVDHWQERDVRA